MSREIMNAAAPTASTIQPAASSRRRRSPGVLIAIALLVGFIVNMGASIYLGPYPVSANYFTVTGPADPGSSYAGPIEWRVQADTRAEAIGALGGQPYFSLAGPTVSSFPEPRSWDQSGDALRIGLFAALLAFVMLYLLGLTARFRPIEARLGDTGAAFWRSFGATRRAKAGSLLLVAAGAIASGLLALALALAFGATATSLGWWDWTYWTTTRLADVAGLTLLLAVISGGIPAAMAIVVRRARISRGVGAFLAGYGGLLAVLWIQGLTSTWSSCGSYPSFLDSATPSPVACFVAEVTRQWFSFGVGSLFAAVPAVGALLAYRAYRRRQAVPAQRLMNTVA
jgi:hypothetical protein